MSFYIKCGKCGWVHVAYGDKQLEESVADEVAYMLAKGETSDIDACRERKKPKDTCIRCGESWTQFVPANPGDAPKAATIQAIYIPAAG